MKAGPAKSCPSCAERYDADVLFCPRDGTPLEPHAYLDVGPTVQRCPTCLGLFAPRAQIEPLQRFHERMPSMPHEPIERSSLLSRLWHAFVG